MKNKKGERLRRIIAPIKIKRERIENATARPLLPLKFKETEQIANKIEIREIPVLTKILFEFSTFLSSKIFVSMYPFNRL